MADRVKLVREYEYKRLVLEEFMQGESVILAADQGIIKYGQVLAQSTADGKYYKYDKSGTDGKKLPRRIYKNDEDIETDSVTEEIRAVVLRAGRVNEDLIIGMDLDDYTGIAELERNGIYLEEVLKNVN